MLATELPDQEDRIACLEEAGLRADRVRYAATPDNAWHHLISRAYDQGRLGDLLDAAAAKNERVANAVDRFRRKT